MERNIASTMNRQVYSYQSPINHQTDFTSLTGGGSNHNFTQSQGINLNSDNRNSSSENGNLIEILNSAIDDSKTEENISNSEKVDNNEIDSEFNVDQTSSMYQDYSSGNELTSEDLFDSKEKPIKCRANTAPTKPKNEAEEFKYSSNYLILEKLSQSSSTLIMKTDGKFDVESEEGSEIIKVFFERLELFIKVILKI